MINENINRPTLHEIFTKVAEAKTREDKSKMLKHYDTPHVRYFLKGAFDDSIEWLIPKGAPPYKETTPKEADHVRKHIVKRFKFFVKGGPKVKSETHREVMFIRILESIDPEDAKLLILCKDREFTGKYKGLTKKLVSDTFPGLIKM